MIPLTSLDHDEELFTHINEKTGEQRTFAISLLIQSLSNTWERYKAIVPITTDDAAYIRANRGIEQHRLDRLSPFVIRSCAPLILIDECDGSWLLIDGSHRYVWLAEQGVKEALAVMLPRDVWEPFLVSGVPTHTEESLANRRSGL